MNDDTTMTIDNDRDAVLGWLSSVIETLFAEAPAIYHKDASEVRLVSGQMAAGLLEVFEVSGVKPTHEVVAGGLVTIAYVAQLLTFAVKAVESKGDKEFDATPLINCLNLASFGLAEVHRSYQAVVAGLNDEPQPVLDRRAPNAGYL